MHDDYWRLFLFHRAEGLFMMNRYSLARSLRFVCFALALSISAFITLAQNASPVIVSRAAHERQWLQTNELGEVLTSFTEIATGLCYWDEAAQTWRDSNPEIEIRQGVAGGISDKGRHKLMVAPNANTATGTVEVILPDGNRVLLKTIGIALTSLDNSQSEFIAELQNSHGEKVDGTTVIFRNAFAPIKADLRIRNFVSGVESDVILRERIDPTEWGLNPDNCRLEVWTEVIEAPGAAVAAEVIPGRRAGAADRDQQIDFSSMSLTKGSAFELNGQPGGASAKNIRVAKTMIHLPDQNATYLIEAIPFTEAAEALQELPVNEARVKRASSRKRMVAQRSAAIKFPGSSNIQPGPAAERMVALLDSPKADTTPGYVIDYTISQNQNGYTFRGDTTYLISGTILLQGTVQAPTKAIFEGGSIIKLGNGSSLKVTANCEAQFLSSPYRPVIFTAADDHTVGDKLNSNTQISPGAYFGVYALRLENSMTTKVKHAVFRFAQTGLSLASGTGSEVRHAQFVNCKKSIETDVSIAVRNALITHSQIPTPPNPIPAITGIAGNGSISIDAEHVTVSAPIGYPFTTFTPALGATLSFQNSIIYGPGASTAYSQTSSVDTWSFSPFQAAGAGSHYLNQALSGALNSGTVPGVDPELLLDLGRMTTERPHQLTGPISTPTTLHPSARRDISYPDLGYHYNAIDYYFSSLTVGAALTVAPGVHLAMYGNTGIILTGYGGGSLISKGSPGSLNRFVHYQMVQEQPTADGWPTLAAQRTFFSPPTSSPTSDKIDLTFCEFSPGGGSSGLSAFIPANSQVYCNIINVSHSVFKNVSFGGVYYGQLSSGGTLSLINNCWERCYVALDNTGPYSLQLYNNLFWKGSTALSYSSTDTYWSIYDNWFDSETLSVSGTGFLALNNGFAYPLATFGSASKSVTSPDYQNGPLGRFYYPLSGANLATLVNAGSRLASAASLSHFTTKVDNVKEMNDPASATKQVDIGFHFVAHDEVWIEDTLPAGAVAGSNSETWTWNSSNPGSGNWSFESAPATGTPAWGGHHLWFMMTSSPFRVSAGEKLAFYVFIPSSSSPQPSAIMMQWYGAGNADWSRAYWGNVNALTAGTLGTYSRRHMSSSLPATDTWIRLEVPASQLNLEGKNITGFGFTRTSGSGKVIWDRVGKSVMDTDLDGLADYLEDADGDNVTDSSETSVSARDTDEDGVSDLTEVTRGTNPKVKQADLLLLLPTNK